MKRVLFAFVFLGLCSCNSTNDADIIYVALGASDVVGIGATPLTNGYAYQIEHGLESPNSDVDLIPAGLPGAEIDDIKSLEVPIAKREDPDLITILTGANDLIDGDLASTFENTLHEILSELTTETHAFVVIGNLPDFSQVERYRNDPDPDVTPARIASFNQAIARQANQFGIPVANLAGIPVTDELTSDADGFHPNDRGHQAIADTFLAVITPVAPTLGDQSTK